MATQLMLKGSGKEKLSKDVPLPILVRYSYKVTGTSCYISTGKKIIPIHWDDDKEKPKNSYGPGAASLKKFLNKIKSAVEDAVTGLQNEDEEPAPDLVRARYLINSGGIERKKTTVLSEWKSRLLRQANKTTERTIKNERASYATFEAFLTNEGKPGLSCAMLNKDILSDYEHYLNTHDLNNPEGKKKKQPAKHFTLNTKGKKLKHLKAFLKSIDHPIAGFIEFDEKPGNKVFLSQKELALFQQHDFTNDPRLDRVRDLFVLQCHTGLRVSDLKRLANAHLNESLTIRAQKNKETVKMPITASMKTILSKYKNELPDISDQKYNDYIKEVAAKVIPDVEIEVTEYRGNQTINKICKKSEVLSSHDAVKTFITLKAQMGMPIGSIAVLTGKTVAVILKSYLGKDEGQAQKDAVKYDFANLAVG